MGPMRSTAMALAAPGLSAILTVAALAAQAGPGLEPGAYDVRDLDTGLKSRICLKDQHQLVQFGNESADCDHLVVSSNTRRKTVRYSCTGSDWGRTTIRIETAKLAHVDSQGIKNGAPFKIRAELRNAGAC